MESTSERAAESICSIIVVRNEPKRRTVKSFHVPGGMVQTASCLESKCLRRDTEVGKLSISCSVALYKPAVGIFRYAKIVADAVLQGKAVQKPKGRNLRTTSREVK